MSYWTAFDRFKKGAKARSIRKGETFLDGSDIPSTHKMSYGSVDGKWVAYPTIFENEDGTWTDLRDAEGIEAMDEAYRRKEVY